MSLDNFTLRKLHRLNRKITRDKRFLSWDQIKNILLIIDLDEVDMEEVNQALEVLSEKDIELVGLTFDKKRQENFPLVYKSKFLGFKHLKSDNLQQITSKNYDLAIAYSKNELWPIAVMLAQTNAKCRVSSEPVLAIITDMTIIPQQMNLRNLLEQTIKYLQTIKTSENDKE